MPLPIAAAIQSQMLQTLLSAMKMADQPLAAGDIVEARFIGWNGQTGQGAARQGAEQQAVAPPSVTAQGMAEKPVGPKAMAQVEIGSTRLNLLISATPERQAALQPGAVLTLRVDDPQSESGPAQVRLLAIGEARVPGHAAQAGGQEAIRAVQTDMAAQGPGAGRAIAAAEQARAAAGPLVGAALGRQDGLAPLFADLAAVVRSPALVPAPVATAALRVLGFRLPTADDVVVPRQLQTGVRTSGVFHEARIAQGDLALAGGDLKSALLVLRDALKAALPVAGPDADALAPPADKPLPASGTRPQAPASDSAASVITKALERTEASLDRLTLGQFASLPGGADPGQSAPLNRWFIELPMALDGRTAVLPLEIEEDHAGPAPGGAEAKLWRVRFALDAEPMGPVHAMVTMQGRSIGVSVWAERDATSRLVRDHAPDLKAALLDADFDRADIEVH
nr:flagellar hook-length control protein FliK [Beijerinckiaceae bacterium]